MDYPNSICVHHSEDNDGSCSAAIVKYINPEVELIPFDYGDSFPWEKVAKDKICYMVDVSLPKEDMERLNNSTYLIYCDHHISKMKELDLTRFKGIQRVGTAACALTWEHLWYPVPIPRGVDLLSRYDVWDLSEDVLNYQYGIRALDLDPNDTPSWIHNVFRDELIPYHIKQGKVIRAYLDQANKKECNDNAFLTTFEGYTALAVNSPSNGSLYFEDHPKYLEVDLLIAFRYDPDPFSKGWKLSLYSLKDNVDCSAIAGLYGGGGHFNAAGCTCSISTIVSKLLSINED